jgi:hypothetical protein
VALIVAVVGLLLAQGSASAQPPRPKKGPGKDRVDSAPVQGNPPKANFKTFAGKTLTQWKRELTHGDASKRTLALMAIMQPVFTDEASTAVVAILARLNDTDLSPRAKACLALRTLAIDKDDVARVVKALAARLDWSPSYGWTEKDPNLRYEVVVALRRFADDAAPAIPALINCTRDRQSWEIRYMAAGTLWRAALATKEKTDTRAVEALLKQFANTNATYQERLEVVIGLGSLGRSNNPSLQARVIYQLQQATTTRNMENKPLAIWAYAGLVNQDGSKAAESLARLVRYLKPEWDLEIRTQAVQALGALGSKAKSKIPAIIVMLDDKEVIAVDAACKALARMGDTSNRVLDALISLTKHKDVNRVGSAVIALANLKANDPNVLAALEKAIDTEKSKAAKEVNTGLIQLTQQAIEYIKKQQAKKSEK